MKVSRIGHNVRREGWLLVSVGILHCFCFLLSFAISFAFFFFDLAVTWCTFRWGFLFWGALCCWCSRGASSRWCWRNQWRLWFICFVSIACFLRDFPVWRLWFIIQGVSIFNFIFVSWAVQKHERSVLVHEFVPRKGVIGLQESLPVCFCLPEAKERLYKMIQNDITRSPESPIHFYLHMLLPNDQKLPKPTCLPSQLIVRHTVIVSIQMSFLTDLEDPQQKQRRLSLQKGVPFQ